jgi:hypothetical protein
MINIDCNRGSYGIMPPKVTFDLEKALVEMIGLEKTKKVLLDINNRYRKGFTLQAISINEAFNGYFDEFGVYQFDELSIFGANFFRYKIVLSKTILNNSIVSTYHFDYVFN